MINTDYIRGLDDAHVNESRQILGYVTAHVDSAGWTVAEIIDYLEKRHEKNVFIRKTHRKIREEKGHPVGT